MSETHSLHKHLAQILADKLAKRRVVAGTTHGRNFEDSLPSYVPATRLHPSALCRDHSSKRNSRSKAWPARICPTRCLLVCLPAKRRDDDTAVLMELEAGGERGEPPQKNVVDGRDSDIPPFSPAETRRGKTASYCRMCRHFEISVEIQQEVDRWSTKEAE